MASRPEFLDQRKTHLKTLEKSYLTNTEIFVLVLQVERLQEVVRDRRANWAQSLATLRAAKAAGARITKTSIMLGCGEGPAEVVAALQELRDNGESPQV